MSPARVFGAALLIAGLSAATALAAPAGEALAPLIVRLGDAQFARRESAQQALVREGHLRPEETLTACVTAYAGETDPEIRHRLCAVLAELVGEHLFHRPRGFLGIAYQQVRTVHDGKRVTMFQVQRVTPDTGAAAAGLRGGDLILRLDKFELGQEVTTEEFAQYIQQRQPGDQLQVTLRRGVETQTVAVVLGAVPPEARDQFYTAERERAFFDAWLAKRLELLGRH
ncbi:PDZ domain-containing protein [bacterium]|nr:PDZ domain-containing protein [bacterium]